MHLEPFPDTKYRPFAVVPFSALFLALNHAKSGSLFDSIFHYQTLNGKAWVEDIPFDLTVDFIPEVLKQPDIYFQKMTSAELRNIEGFSDIEGRSDALRKAVVRASKAAIRDVPVLLMGETGTGKEMFARAIHHHSSRKSKPFKAVNCAAIPSELLESELFGHAKGAFTGAVEDKKGIFEQADGGTVFLDEVGECSLMMQAKLLRVMQPPPGKGPSFRAFTRVGDHKEYLSDVRIISATNKNLAHEVAENHFREDLLYRLAVITITLPPLRDRKADISILADKFISQINTEFKEKEPAYQSKTLPKKTKSYLESFPWPGNIRQLYNVLLQTAVMGEKQNIDPEDIEQALGQFPVMNAVADPVVYLPEQGINLDEYLDKLRIKYFECALERCGGVKTRAAKLLGIKHYQTMDARMKRLSS